MERSRTYSEYLALDELLSLQRPKSDGPEHDEHLFIIIHQVYELWFRQVLHEVDHLGRLLDCGDSPRALHTLERVLTIFKTLVGQIDILETMTPLEFLSFRDRLDSASGFESFQFRELEFALGMKDPTVLGRFPAASTGNERLQSRIRQPSLWQVFVRYADAKGHAMPAQALSRDAALPTESCEAVQATLIDIYRNDDELTPLCERLVDLDEGMQEWRYRHVKMVQRTIGTKPGTGGSSGAEYLSQTLFRPLFPDLWAIRGSL